MRQSINDALKQAMKDQDRLRTSTLRLMTAAFKDRDIANRGAGTAEAGTDDLLQILSKMIKQREESAMIYAENGREELAVKERAEIAIIREFMPAQMDDAGLKEAVAAAIAETGASAMKDIGRVMAVLKERYAGQMDFAKANGAAKAMLTPAS